MANELRIDYATGNTLYAYLMDRTGQVWNGAAWETPQNANWLTYAITLTEAGTTGIYRGNMPAVTAAWYWYGVRLQAGGAPAVADAPVGDGTLAWSGTLIEGITALEVENAVWDAALTGASHNTSQSAGRKLRTVSSPIITTDFIVSATVNTAVLAASAENYDGAYDPAMIYIVNGTGAGQCRGIYEYVGATKTVVVDRNWKVIPDVTSEYVIGSWAGREHVNEGLARGGTLNTITLNALASSDPDTYLGQVIFLRSGTGEDQARRVSAYDHVTKIATLRRNWATIPDATTGYVMLPQSIMTSDCVSEGVWPVPSSTWGVTPGSMGEALLQAAGGSTLTPAEIWNYYTRTLTQSQAHTPTPRPGDPIEMWQYSVWSISFTGLGDLSARTSLYFTMKDRQSEDLPDANADFQVEESAGLLHTSSVATWVAGDATLTVDDQVQGNITITAKTAATAMAVQSGKYDVRMITAAGAQPPSRMGAYIVHQVVTQTV